MGSLAAELDTTVRAMSVRVSDDTITVELEDGRTIVVPTVWYPRLLHANRTERARYEIDEVGITWPRIDADFSIRGLLLGRKSGESSESLKFWLEARRKGKKVTLDDLVKSKARGKKTQKVTSTVSNNR
jgi:hypothetical protein